MITAWLVWLLHAAPALPQAELIYIRGAGSEACDETKLRQAVASRLGYDPFVAKAPVRVVVRLGGSGPLSAQVSILRPNAPLAERTLTGNADCNDLTEALALALAVAVDPLVLTRPLPLAPVPAQPPAPPAAPPTALRRELDLAASVALESQPGIAGGLRLGAQVGNGFWSVRLEGYVLLPSRAAIVGGGSVEGLSVGGMVGPCLRVKILSGCLLARGGALRFEGHGLDVTRSGWLGTFAAGTRLGAEWPLESAVAGFAALEAWVPVTQIDLRVGDAIAWNQGPLEGAGLIGVRLRAF